MKSGGTLVCAIDRDERAPGLIACARQWAAETGMRALFLHAHGRVTPAGEGQLPELRWAIQRARAEFADLGLAADELRIVSGDPLVALLKAMRRERPGLVLVGSGPADGHRIGALCAGLLRSAPRPLAILPPGGERSFSGGPIACAISFGDDEEAAVRFAGDLATATGRRLVLVHVLGAADAAQLAAARARAALTGEPTTEVRVRPLAEHMTQVARESEADALVIASRRPRDVAAGGGLGSAAERLWTSAPCPVVIVERR